MIRGLQDDRDRGSSFVFVLKGSTVDVGKRRVGYHEHDLRATNTIYDSRTTNTITDSMIRGLQDDRDRGSSFVFVQ